MHWLYENGIGEERAALVRGSQIIKARIERAGDSIRPGAVLMAQLIRKIGTGKRAIATLSTGEDVIISSFPGTLTEGQELRVRITRTAITEQGPEQGRYKYALAKGVGDDIALAPSPSLLEQIEADGTEVKHCPAHGPDLLAKAGWNELLHEAQSGHVAFPGGTLEIVPTPAMAVVDVDGESAPRQLALNAAQAAAKAIERLSIGGNIGIDFPALPTKADRADVTIAVDQAMQGPFERTAVNGFGFMQIVRKYERPSLLQVVQDTPDLTALLDLLRCAQRDPGTSKLMLHLTAPMKAIWDEHEAWQAALVKQIGRSVDIAAKPACTREASCLSGTYDSA
ncbi:ribonuclease E/G [Sphingorhabdus sp. Alg239-R122]|uniref:ribonuclease E/G n=1 Tax=Sphingorhabdus sp. Alg239-R122 TaxID=2305989 RepID=UPI0013DCAA24|nr:ribonuclease E/G [Sphingorhabdus sp. Alg239-R122]